MGDGKAERLGGLQVNGHIELGRQLNGLRQALSQRNCLGECAIGSLTTDLLIRSDDKTVPLD